MEPNLLTAEHLATIRARHDRAKGATYPADGNAWTELAQRADNDRAQLLAHIVAMEAELARYHKLNKMHPIEVEMKTCPNCGEKEYIDNKTCFACGHTPRIGAWTNPV